MSVGMLRRALVLAARQARRHRLRAVAIVITLALPVAVVTAADVVRRTSDLTRTERLNRQLGGAQALITWFGTAPIVQSPDPENGGAGPVAPATTSGPASFTLSPPPASLPPALVPAGATATGEADDFTFLISPAGGTEVHVRGVDLRAPAPASGVVIRSGRIPASPDEIVLSPPAARQLQARVGDPLRAPGFSLRVVGIVEDRYDPANPVAFTFTSTALGLEALQSATGPHSNSSGVTQWYLSSPVAIDWAAVEAFNAQGWLVTSRSVVLHPPPPREVPYFHLPIFSSPRTPATRTNEAGAFLLGAMLLLEVVLMSGPAFAVGARRRRHELAIVAASGGARRDLVAIVVADGLLLGAVAAVIGAALGVIGGAATVAGLRAWTSRVPGAVTIPAWQVLGIASLALVSGLLAALIPALAASRPDTARVLRGRHTLARLTWRPPVAGLVAVGVAVALAAANLNQTSSRGLPVSLVLAAALAEVGFVLLTPGLLSLAGRLSRGLSLWPRLAVRDASRNRSAAGPAVAAIIAVVAAVTAALVYGSSIAAHDRVSFQPSTIIGDAVTILPSQALEQPLASHALEQPPAPQAVQQPPAPHALQQPAPHALQQPPAPQPSPLDLGAAVAVVRSQLPGATVLSLRGGGGDRQVAVVPPPTPGCPSVQYQFGSDTPGFGAIGGVVIGSGGRHACPFAPPSGTFSSFFVDDGSNIAPVLGDSAGATAAAALKAGKAVVFDPSLLSHGMVTLALGPGQPSSATMEAVAVASPTPTPPAAIVLPLGAPEHLNLQVLFAAIYVPHAASLPKGQVLAADRALEQRGVDGLAVQEYHNTIGSLLFALLIADLVLALGAAVAATALVSVDAADDLQILAAVGAAPNGRRRLAMSRAGFICGIGSVFGAAAGLIPGVALVRRLRHQRALNSTFLGHLDNSYPLHFPWVHLIGVVVAVPLLAAGAAALVGRSRLPVERRRAV